MSAPTPLVVAVVAAVAAAVGFPAAAAAATATGLGGLSSTNYCSPSGKIQDACCEYSDVETVNSKVNPLLEELVTTSFFRYYKMLQVNLEKECPFWKENLQCSNVDCSVTVADEAIERSEIPDAWKAGALSTVDFTVDGGGGSGGNLGSGNAAGLGPFQLSCEYSEKDFCLVEDEARADGVYVNLLLNPERFTGYAGPSAARIWRSVYEENCFGAAPIAVEPTQQQEQQPEGLIRRPLEEECTEGRVFYRLVSGLHTSISTHICDRHLDRSTGVWYRDLDCFMGRVGDFPERIENLYFTYVVLLRAVTKLSPYLQSYAWCTGADADQAKIKALLTDILEEVQACPSTFDEKMLFTDKALKDEFKSHFRNISRIMDCVGCEKCRLWGKLQISGKPSSYKLTRSEIVALINGFTRISHSVEAVGRFRTMYQERLAAAAATGAGADAVAAAEQLPRPPLLPHSDPALEEAARDTIQAPILEGLPPNAAPVAAPAVADAPNDTRPPSPPLPPRRSGGSAASGDEARLPSGAATEPLAAAATGNNSDASPWATWGAGGLAAAAAAVALASLLRRSRAAEAKAGGDASTAPAAGTSTSSGPAAAARAAALRRRRRRD
ncbi:hypothetical protein HK405_005556 [Cladochytrium tenue]|nr:hypothetical protein HK405_005556 [Cladochytrium tenue]